MVEIWENIKNYEGKYQVSNMGNVKSLNFNNTKRPAILVKKVNRRGYEYVCLSQYGKRSYSAVHRLVAEAFIPNPDNKEQINHIDGNKRNNSMYNLEWVSQSENINHAIRTGLLKLNGAQNGRSKKVQQIDLNGNVINTFDCLKDAGKFLGKENRSTKILEACKGRRKTAYGYKWQYLI